MARFRTRHPRHPDLFVETESAPFAWIRFDSPLFAATLRAMSKPLVPLLLAVLALSALGACARSKPKSSAHIYSGDAPTIKFSNKPESAGGHINTY